MDVVGVIPSAGRGTRLGLPFSKEMFPDIRNHSYRPIIMYTIDAMKLAGIRHLIFTVNPNKTDLLRFLGNGRQFGMNFSYCVHPEPRSLPESLHEAYHLTVDKRVVIAMPDTVIHPVSFAKELLYAHSRLGGQMTLGCFRTLNPSKFGMVQFEGVNAKCIVDKPRTSDLEWMWGTMVWEPEVTEKLRDFVNKNKDDTSNRELVLTDAFDTLLLDGQAKVHCFHEGAYKDLGTFGEIIDWGVTEKVKV